MKLTRNIYSRLTLITCVTLITGYILVYAWAPLNPADAGPNKPLTAGLMQGIVNNINELNVNLATVTGKFWTLTNGKYCTTDGTKIDCTTTPPVAGGTNLWNTGASSSINYTAGKVGVGTSIPNALLHVYNTGANAELDIQSIAGVNKHWGIYNDASNNSLKFWNNDIVGEKNAVTILNNGNVGIGTVSPISPLQVNNSLFTGTASDNAGAYITSSNRNGFLQLDGASTAWTSVVFSNALSEKGRIFYNNTSNYLSFSTNAGGVVAGGERVRIDSSGNVGIGTVSPVTSLHVAKDISDADLTGGGGQMILGWASSPIKRLIAGYNTTGNYGFLQGNTFGATWDNISLEPRGGNVGIGTTNPWVKFQVGENADGTLARANSWTTFSDERLKKDFSSILSPLEKLEHIGGYYYFWKKGSDTSRQLGVKAQEVEKVFPEIVSTGGDGYKSVDYGKLGAVLIEAIKELSHKLDELFVKYLDQQNEINSLKQENIKILERLDKLEQR